MTALTQTLLALALAATALLAQAPAAAQTDTASDTASASAINAPTATIGRIKTLAGSVNIDRAGQPLPALIGMALQQGDRLRTGPDGGVGITLADDSLLTAGPSSQLVISRFAFNPTTHDGALDATLSRGSLHVVSGLIAKKKPEAISFRARSVVLGVRGTEFIIDLGTDPL